MIIDFRCEANIRTSDIVHPMLHFSNLVNLTGFLVYPAYAAFQQRKQLL
jgi:hypothetical protein